MIHHCKLWLDRRIHRKTLVMSNSNVAGKSPVIQTQNPLNCGRAVFPVGRLPGTCSSSPLAASSRAAAVFVCHLPGESQRWGHRVGTGRQGQATRTHVVVIRHILTTSKILRLQTLKNLTTLQSVNCAAICIHYLILLSPAASLHLDSTLIQYTNKYHFSVGFRCCCCCCWFCLGFLCAGFF